MDTLDLKQIGLFRLSAIGDVVMMVPVVRALQRTYPNAKITWMTSRLAYSILEGLSGVDFKVIDKPKSFSSYWQCQKQLREFSFDVLLAAQASMRAHLLYPFIKAPIKIGFDAKRAKDAHGLFVNRRISFSREHLLDSFMRFAKTLGAVDAPLEWHLPISNEHYDWAKRQLSIKTGKWLAINPMASKQERNWFVDRYAEVIDKAVERWGVNIVLTGGPGVEEKRMSQEIVEKTKQNCLVLTGKTNLKQMAAVLSQVDVLVAPDTGPVHIATAMGTPVVGLYAVAPPELSGPYLSQHLVVNKYPKAVKQFLKKDPSTVAWGKRVHTQDAMALITVEDVLEKLSDIF